MRISNNTQEEKNVKVIGTVETRNEELIPVVQDLAAILQLPALRAEDAGTVHRLPSKEGKTAPTLISFNNGKILHVWVNKKKVLRQQESYIN